MTLIVQVYIAVVVIENVCVFVQSRLNMPYTVRMNVSPSVSEIRQQWSLLVSAGTGVFFSVIVLPYYSISALVVPVTEAFGWTRAEFQAAIFFSSTLGALTAPLVGWLCGRFGVRRVALPGLFGLSLGFAIASTMQGELWVLYLAYGSMALFGAGTIPVTWTAAIASSFSQQRGLALGIVLTGTGICGVLIPQYATFLVEQFVWRAAYIGIALLPVFIAWPVVYFWFKPNAGSPVQTSPSVIRDGGLTLAQALRRGKFWVLLGSIFLVYMATSGIGLNLYAAVTDAGMSNGQAATVQSIFGAAIIIGRLVVGYLIDKLWAPGVAAAVMILPVFGSMMLIDPSTFLWASLAAFLIGVAAGAELDLMSFLTARYFGLQHYAQIYAIMYMALAICSGTAPIIFAGIFDRTSSYAVSFTITTVLFVCSSLVILLMGRYPPEFKAAD